MEVVRAEALTKRYDTVTAVDRLDLTIEQGNVVAVLGPNGAGKSTTIEMLLGLRAPTSGAVRVFGAAPTSARTRARVGAMLQDSEAPDALSAAETIDLVRHYYPYALPLQELLERADLVDKRHHRVAQLSGGQRQRLSYALAVAGDPDLLFLDEPTASLDVEARHRFWEQIRRFATTGKTVLFSTHNLAEADALADRIVVISHGRVVADGTPEQVKATVAARTVSLVTDVPLERLAAMPGVRHVAPAPGEAPGATRAAFVVHTSEPESLLRALFVGGHRVEHLRVTDADLETAFMHLVGQPTSAPPASTADILEVRS